MRCYNHQCVAGKLQKIVNFSRRSEKEFTTNDLNLLAYERVKRKQDEHVVLRNGVSVPMKRVCISPQLLPQVSIHTLLMLIRNLNLSNKVFKSMKVGLSRDGIKVPSFKLISERARTCVQELFDVVLIQLEYETDDQKEWIEGEVAVGLCIDIKAMLEQWEFGTVRK